MRPVELTIEGLRSFRRPATITFADRQLVAIIGDTGAGKSSILEALTWALYGNATWTKHAGVLVGDGCAQMRVRLAFEADGNTWQVTRAIKRRQDGTTGPTNAELVCLDGQRPAADGVRQVNPAIEQLLGLDWDAFTRTVVLPQGQFARLLTEGDVDRMRILAQIWRTDELVAARDQADDALRELTTHLQYLRGRRQGYPDDVTTELNAAVKHATNTKKAAEAADDAVREATRCQTTVEQAQGRAASIREAAAKLQQAAEGNVTGEAAELAAAAERFNQELAVLETRSAKQQGAVTEIEQAANHEADERETIEQAVNTLDRLAASLDDLADHTRRARKLHDGARKLHSDAESLRAEAEQAKEQLGEAEQDVARWQRVDAAATAAHGLHHGDDCPVCARELPVGWQAPAASGLEQATGTLEAVRARVQEVRDNHARRRTEAKTTANQAKEETDRLAARLDKVTQAVQCLPEPYRPRLPEPFTAEATAPEQLTEALIADVQAAARKRQNELAARQQQLHQAREALQQLREERTGLKDRLHTEVTQPADRLRSRLQQICERAHSCAEVGVQLASAIPEPSGGLKGLTDDAQAVAAMAQVALHSAEEQAADIEQEAGNERKRLASLLRAAEVATLDALTQRQVNLRADAQQAQTRVVELERIAPIVAALDAHLAEGTEVAGALTDLKTLLQDGRFIRWLTLRRSKALLAVASTLLDEMTGGRYAFADITDEHDEWRIFDTETGYARSPRTLSGGESFVASLALALGMVEMVARSGGRLDALFLDEGFGALDRENLDAAIDALESSATKGRMVAVISHVQAVAERLTDVAAVERTPTGSEVHWLTHAEREGMAVAEATTSVRNLLS